MALVIADFAGGAAVKIGGEPVEADDLGFDAAFGELRDDGIERDDRTRVPDMGVGQVDLDVTSPGVVRGEGSTGDRHRTRERSAEKIGGTEHAVEGVGLGALEVDEDGVRINFADLGDRDV